MSRPVMGPTQPPLQCVLRILSVTVMQPQHEADHSHSPSVEVKNGWSYTSLPPYALIAGTGTTLSESCAHRDSNKRTVNVCQRHWLRSYHAYTCANSHAHPDWKPCTFHSQPDLKLYPNFCSNLYYWSYSWSANTELAVDCVWNVMAHAQKPYFVFRQNRRVRLNRRGHQFSRLLAAELCASSVLMLDTPHSEVVWWVPATHSIRQFPLHFPSRASPCAITFQLDSTNVHNVQLNVSFRIMISLAVITLSMFRQHI